MDNKIFMDTVKNCWNREITGEPIWIFHMKMKRLASTLSNWSKTEYGDIYINVKEYEEKVRLTEEEAIHNNTGENRAKLHWMNAEYIKFLKLKNLS